MLYTSRRFLDHHAQVLVAVQPEARERTFDIGDGRAVSHIGDDSWGIMGQRLKVHNSFWGLDGDKYSDARVVGYIGAFRFPAGKRSKHTYVIECEGNCYPAPHTTVASSLDDAAIKRRVRKAAPPRLL